MRLQIVGIALGVFTTALCQAQTLFDTVRPDVSVTVRKHPLGSDLVEISYVQPGYPVELIQRHVESLGRELRSPIQGLRLVRRKVGVGAGEMSYMKATFGVAGLIDRDRHRIDLQSLVRCFAVPGSSSPIHGMVVVFDGEIPDEHTIRAYPTKFLDTDPVQLQGIRMDSPPSLEYRILVRATEPTEIVIPSSVDDVPVPVAPKPPPPGSDTSLYLLAGVAALAVGGLVYALLLRPRNKRSVSSLGK